MKYILPGPPYGPLGFSGYSYGYGLNAQPLYAFLPPLLRNKVKCAHI